MDSPSLVIMAAGMGSRYGGVKQIDPVGPSGEILLDYAAFDAIRAGFEDVVLVIREEIEAAVRERVDPTIGRQCRVRYAHQRTADVPEGASVDVARSKPWGTTHAVLACRGLLDGPFAVINADDFYGREAYDLLYEFLRRNGGSRGLELALVGYTLSRTLTDHGHVSRGVCVVSPDGWLEGIRERKRIQRFGDAVRYADIDDRWHDLAPDATASMNVWGFPLEALAELERRFAAFVEDPSTDRMTGESLLPDVVGDMVRDGCASVRVLPTSADWFGVTYPEDRAGVEERIRELVARGTYPERLWPAAD